MRKLFGIVSMLVLALMPVTTIAQDAEIDGIYYYLDDADKTAEVTHGDNNYSGDIIIPSTVSYEGKTYTVTAIGNQAFRACGVKSVRLPNTIVKIGKEAFWDCNVLESVNIPNGVRKIENATFYNCRALHSIDLPDGLVSIGDEAFEIRLNGIGGNIGLYSINIPNTVTSIGRAAFMNCGYLASVVLPENLTIIKEKTFYYCAITSITIPQGVTAIQDYAFAGCPLNEVTLPDGLLSLGEGAFSSCPLTSFNIPKGITSLPVYAFSFHHCVSLDIPSHVTSIGSSALRGPLLKSVKIPNTVTYLGGFRNSAELSSITIPNSVTSMDSYAFERCSKLRKVRLSENLTSITPNMFEQCTALETITIPEKVTSIGERAFFRCDMLESIEIPDNVKNIGPLAFEATGLTSVSIGKGVTLINNEAFASCKYLTDMYCYATTPPKAASGANIFYLTPIKNATLHVPNSALNKYKQDGTWSQFGTIVGMSEEEEKPKCSTPTISYENGKVFFACRTANSECVADIEDADVTRHYGNEIQLSATYTIKVYAMASGYKNSDVATATLCWIDQQPKMDGFTESIAQVVAKAVLIKNEDGRLIVQGADDGTQVRAYGINGTTIGSAVIQNGMAVISTSQQLDSVIILNIGNKSVKVRMK